MTKKRLCILAGILLACVIAAPIIYSVATNEVHLRSVEAYAASVSHPNSARHIRHIASVGNFAPGGNQCAFVVIDYWSAPLSKGKIQEFYEPFMVDSFEPRTRYLNVYFVDELDDLPLFKSTYSPLFNDDDPLPFSNETLYITVAEEGGHTPNLDPRCH